MRRTILATIFLLRAALFGADFPRAEAQQQVSDFDGVTSLAAERARAAYHRPQVKLPPELGPDQLNYDGYRKIRFRQDHAWWLKEKLPFHVEFYHPGYIYPDGVRVYEIDGNQSRRIPFMQEAFDYSDLEVKTTFSAETGYAGFKVAGAFGKPGEFPELISFLGGSYFRMVGVGLQMGTAGRGLALDSGQTDRSEEFPIFTDFWLRKPAPDARELQILALLDSVSCTGAYEFTIAPGETTENRVRAVLFFRAPDQIKQADPERKPLVTLGLAPLTSMFWYGENTFRKWHDFRPEVHDADTLLVQAADGTFTARTLSNPPAVRHSTFSSPDVRGFGLIQRDRTFESYQDIARPYQQTASVWIEPQGQWGEGEVHLVEIPTGNEALDNIVAFWDPKERPKPLEPFRFAYRQRWTSDPQKSEDRVVAVRFGAEGNQWQALVDFDGPSVRALDEKHPPKVIAHCSKSAKLVSAQAVRNPFGAPWRAAVKFEPGEDANACVELHCQLEANGRPIGEQWTYVWDPP